MARTQGATTKRRSTLGERIEARLVMLNMTQADLVRKSGITQALLGHLRSGSVQKVDMFRIFDLADALECDARWLAMGFIKKQEVKLTSDCSVNIWDEYNQSIADKK